MSIPGAFLLVLLAISRVAWMVENGPTVLSLLLFAQAGLAALLMIFRRKAAAAAPPWVEASAWFSAAMPLLFHTPAAQHPWQCLLPVPGLALTLWALASLGTAFGIAPARRSLVVRGPYRLLRHPMYAGELLSLAGAWVSAPGLWNLAVFLAFAASLVWRISQEERILDDCGYTEYAVSVRWRLLPGVW